MKLEYNIETLLFHLKHVKKMCSERPDCTDCPFNIEKNWHYCLFVGPYNYENCIPQDWDIDNVNKKEGD